MYFTTFDYKIYRTDFAFAKVDKVTVDTPDLIMLDKAMDVENSITFRGIDLLKIEGDSLYFNIMAYNFDGAFYSGGYKMKLAGARPKRPMRGIYQLRLLLMKKTIQAIDVFLLFSLPSLLNIQSQSAIFSMSSIIGRVSWASMP